VYGRVNLVMPPYQQFVELTRGIDWIQKKGNIERVAPLASPPQETVVGLSWRGSSRIPPTVPKQHPVPRCQGCEIPPLLSLLAEAAQHDDGQAVVTAAVEVRVHSAGGENRRRGCGLASPSACLSRITHMLELLGSLRHAYPTVRWLA